MARSRSDPPIHLATAKFNRRISCAFWSGISEWNVEYAFSMSNPVDREVAVFSEARQLPAGARAAYLDQACAGDAALRQRVEELLHAGEEAGGFLQHPRL